MNHTITDLLSFRVYGKPVTQGHMIAALTNDGRPYLRQASGSDWEDWRREIAWEAKTANNGRAPLACPVAVTMTFWLDHGRYKVQPGSPAAQWPDLDTLCRAVLDGITVAGVWKDDKQATDLSLCKRWVSDLVKAPGVEVRLFPVTYHNI